MRKGVDADLPGYNIVVRLAYRREGEEKEKEGVKGVKREKHKTGGPPQRPSH